MDRSTTADKDSNQEEHGIEKTEEKNGRDCRKKIELFGSLLNTRHTIFA